MGDQTDDWQWLDEVLATSHSTESGNPCGYFSTRQFNDCDCELKYALGAIRAKFAEQAHPFIKDLKCPACGMTGTIFVASGNYLTCSTDTCPNSDFAEAQAKLHQAEVEK